ncbi:MAG: MCE family protein [Myxococcales bacterium]|nr:MCE family protein [Myxococcales bacterium]
MAEVGDAAKVGAMTVGLCAALFAGYRFVSRASDTGSGYTVWAHLPDVTGVAPRSRVMVSGVQVGVVDDIALADGKPRVDIRMRPEYPLYADAAIGKRATSLIGEYFIVLTPGTRGLERIPDGGEVTHLMQDATFESLQNQLKDILLDVKGITKSLHDTVGSDTGQKKLESVLDHLASMTEQLDKTVTENRENVRATLESMRGISADTRPELAAILANIRDVTAFVKATTQPSDPGKPGGELRRSIERVDRASASLESVLGHANSVAERIDKGQGTLGRLSKDEALIDEVEEVVEGVGDLVGGLKRTQTIVGLRSDYNFLANTLKAYVALRLQPTEDKYYLIELVNDPRGKLSIEQIDVDTTNPNDPPHYREIRTVTTNAFRFSFQFAKRLGPVTGRFGVKESTGGLGIDLHLLGDRLELSQDLFGFGEQVTPRWRVALGYEFVRSLWLLGGVDNLLNADRRDYFFGLQLRFNDEDLKTVLPFSGNAFGAGH